ncbi:PHP domain-containing protein [Dactylosporangium aurantiacum]|uniref:PHP domain-containing protein n=1 Tax=Dactylosporangium aurantiacum TaxID=35754 RepID=UPI001FE05F03|nr:PHP domain-containing protein [Dactylosporangium aurantiacum]MDG6106953.1 PHP domain-containing protein [Dactylosporangium aurantiacum]
MLPADNHVHSEWSWDALGGSMMRSCAAAAALGLRAIAFTEHADFTRWTIPPQGVATMPAEFQAMIGDDGRFYAPAFDHAGYAESIERCRAAFPGLRIRSGVELGEPHWHADAARDLLARYPFDRVVGSVHSLADRGVFAVVDRLYGTTEPHDVVRRYLTEVLRMVQDTGAFAILGHVDYPLRAWPQSAGTMAVAAFEEELRAVLTALAGTGRIFELNTRLAEPFTLLRWWRDSGGRWLSFGSDAHGPAEVAHNFAVAKAMAEAAGFRPVDDQELWGLA